jgi:hypothetical protein
MPSDKMVVVFKSVLLFAISRLGFVAIVMDKAGEAAVLSFATSRVRFVALVADRAGRCSSVVFAGSLNFLVPSDSSVTEAEDLKKVQERSRVVTYVTPSNLNFVPLRLPSIRMFV